MKTQFLQTANVRELVAGIGNLMNRGPGVPALAVVHGEAGRGKTEATQWYAINKGARYLEANAMWGDLWMLSDFYACLCGLKRYEFGTKKKAFEACLRSMEKESLPVIIDEAERIIRRYTQLEAIRDLSDRTGVPIIFVGTDKVLFALQHRETFASRVSQVVTFKPLTRDEVKMVAAERCGLSLNDEGAARLLDCCGGYIRDLVTALEHLERAAKANRTSEPSVDIISAVAKRAILRAA